MCVICVLAKEEVGNVGNNYWWVTDKCVELFARVLADLELV